METQTLNARATFGLRIRHLLQLKRYDLTADWIRFVHKRLLLWVREELGGREVRLFVDEDRIETGDRWPDSLKDALKRSRCMVCVWYKRKTVPG